MILAWHLLKGSSLIWGSPPSCPCHPRFTCGHLSTSLPAEYSALPRHVSYSRGSPNLLQVARVSRGSPNHAVELRSTTLPSADLVVPKPKGDEKQTKPLYKVANSIVPIPGKLVSRIQTLEYIDLRELLPDNLAIMTLARHLQTQPII